MADENRIMTETAAMLVKYTINEEIIRLHSHLKAMRDEINSNPIPGKKLDFICQEANREINTIGSKWGPGLLPPRMPWKISVSSQKM